MGIDFRMQMSLLLACLVLVAGGFAMPTFPGGAHMVQIDGISNQPIAKSTPCTAFCPQGCDSDKDSNKPACKACAACWERAEKLRHFVSQQRQTQAGAEVTMLNKPKQVTVDSKMLHKLKRLGDSTQGKHMKIHELG